jgi:hypothetical protein
MRYPVAIETGDAKHAFGVIEDKTRNGILCTLSFRDGSNHSNRSLLVGSNVAGRQPPPSLAPVWSHL